jgi:UDP-N-acetylglucosamine:LPS N-acetylglucosamine transferase
MPAYDMYDHFYVLNDNVRLPKDMLGRTYFIHHAERNMKLLVNFWEAFRILLKEKPLVILSTGAGPVVPFAIVGRLFFGARVLFVESMARIHAPSLTGRIMHFIAHDVLYQWPQLRRFFPRGKYTGLLI